jgi:LysM repeat protein
MYKNGTYGSISGTSGSSLGQTNSKRRETEERDRRKARAAAKMGDDLDISAILAATSITSITGQPSKANPLPKQAQQDRDVDRGKGKGKEKVRHGQFSSDKGKGKDKKSKGNEPIFHTVSFADTLEGIALKYGVQVADIKRVNRLFSNQDLFARKELVIPSPEELEEQIVRPRRSYERDITSPGRRSFEKGNPQYFYPATPEDEVAEQRRSLLGFSYNFTSENGEDAFRGLGTEGAGVRFAPRSTLVLLDRPCRSCFLLSCCGSS